MEEEGLGRVPIYFYDPYAPTDDYWSIDEVNNLEAEEAREEESTDNDPLDKVSLNLLFDERVTNNEIRVIHPITDRFGNWWGFVGTRRIDGDNDESANQSDNEVLMINLGDEKDCSELVVDAERGAYPNWTVEHALKYKTKNADSYLSSDSDSDSRSTQSESSFSSSQTTESSKENLVKVPKNNIYFEFDSEMSFDNFSNEKENLEYFTSPMINYVDSDNPNFEEEILEFIEREEERHAKPFSEEIITANLGSKNEPKLVKIGATLSSQESGKLILLLKEYKDVFAWSYKDMPGIDPEIVQHKIPLHPDAKPVKQKLRRMRPDWVLKIKEEVTKQINAGFLIVTEYL
ncbi:hypothetical protein RHMOL_Rhmol01G0183000 [Rhododendron molle]|uniref:Uncharacterized protein n=1 Tax=Rhododendron molle TaxID=49168 RepID=A0ACC0Q339_RHOML|nr:hypothetical protein RHMOL_Rhmol01G0183000 [Rhododendron molle]